MVILLNWTIIQFYLYFSQERFGHERLKYIVLQSNQKIITTTNKTVKLLNQFGSFPIGSTLQRDIMTLRIRYIEV